MVLMLIAASCHAAAQQQIGIDQRSDQFEANLLRVDEGRYLGQAVADVTIVTSSGNRKLSDLIAARPTIVLLAYFSCQHSCPVTIWNLSQMDIDAPESDYQVLVLSFDINDSLGSMARATSRLDGIPDNWAFGLLQGDEARRLTESVGFKFFYSERDGVFVHPAVLVFLSPEGEVMRYLYGAEPRPRDVELALIESRNRAPRLNEIVEMVKLTCFQFDSSKSRYVLHPTIIFGSAGIGVLGLVGLAALASNKHSRGGI